MRPAKAVKLGEEFLKGISEGELVSMQVMEKDYNSNPRCAHGATGSGGGSGWIVIF